MAWIQTIDDGEATGELSEVYDRLREHRGNDRVANILRLHSLNPTALALSADFMEWLMRGESRLTFAQREMIATVTSAVNRCRYCTVAHAESLRGEGADDLAVERIKDDWRELDLTPGERAMLEFCEKLTLSPSAMSREDVERLRSAGWTDRDILDITQICAYFNYRDRLADALGVQIDAVVIERANEGAKRAAAQAVERGETLPADPWDVRTEDPSGSDASQENADS